MSEQHPTIEDIRELNQNMLSLVEKGCVYAVRTRDPYAPRFIAACYCSTEVCSNAIPLDELQRTFREAERAFVARDN